MIPFPIHSPSLKENPASLPLRVLSNSSKGHQAHLGIVAYRPMSGQVHPDPVRHVSGRSIYMPT